MNLYRFAAFSLACVAATAVHADASKQTDWWRLPGAAVVEYSDAQQGKVCSLFLYGRDTAAVVTWTANDDREITLYNNNWHFDPARRVGVAIQIGDTWLNQTAHERPNEIPAAADANHVTLAVGQPVEALLQHGDGITAKVSDRGMSLSVTHSQMRQLVHAVQRCRAAVQRQR